MSCYSGNSVVHLSVYCICRAQHNNCVRLHTVRLMAITHRSFFEYSNHQSSISQWLPSALRSFSSGRLPPGDQHLVPQILPYLFSRVTPEIFPLFFSPMNRKFGTRQSGKAKCRPWSHCANDSKRIRFALFNTVIEESKKQLIEVSSNNGGRHEDQSIPHYSTKPTSKGNLLR